jgi:hypothetical protein
MSTSVKSSLSPVTRTEPTPTSCPLSIIRTVAPTFAKLEATLCQKINPTSPFEINRQLMNFQAMLASARKALEPVRSRTVPPTAVSEFTTQRWIEGTLELTGLLEEKTRTMYRKDPKGCAKLRQELLHGDTNIPLLVRRVGEYHERLLVESQGPTIRDLTSPKRTDASLAA